MMRRFLIPLFFICLGLLGNAQSGTFIALDSKSELITIDPNSCTATPLQDLSKIATITAQPFAIALFGNLMYMTDKSNDLYVSNGSPFKTWTKLTTFSALAAPTINGLTVDKKGVVYAASNSKILTYDPVTKKPLLLPGTVPDVVGGDLLFYKDTLYMSTKANTLSQIDLKNVSNSTTYLKFTTPGIFGFASVTVPCAPNKAFALAKTGEIVTVNLESRKELDTICTIKNYTIYDAASLAETQSSIPPAAPSSASPLNTCLNSVFGFNITLSDAVNDTLRWYLPPSKTPVGKPIVNTAILASNYYQVTEYNKITGCESDSIHIIVNVKPNPAAPTASATAPTCAVASTLSVTSSKTNLAFSIDGIDYTNTTGVFPNLAGGIYPLTAKDLTYGCISPAASDSVAPQPPMPATVAISPNVICDSMTPTFKASNGTLYQFYKNGVAQTTVSDTATYAPGLVTLKDTICVRSYGTPAITFDGNIAEADWGAAIATTVGGPTSGFSSKPQLNALYVKNNIKNLYVALAATVHNDERIVIFIDSKTGGYKDGNFSRGFPGTANASPNGLDNFNQANQFDNGFLPDYALTIGTNAAENNYYANLYKLSGTAADRSSGGPNWFIGDNKVIGALPTFGSFTKGFEVAIPLDSLGYTESFGNIQLMAMYTDNIGTLSNQFLTKANAGEADYGKIPVFFNAAAPNPISYTFSPNCYSEACVTVNAKTTSTTKDTICDGGSYTFNGSTYKTAGTYLAHLTNSKGCDSTATLELAVKATSTSTTPISICAGDSYTFNGTVYKAAGSYTAHLINSVGCDSAATLVLTVKATSTSTTPISICAGDSYTFNGTVYTTAGSYTAHLTNSVGCDSAATLVLTVKATSTSTTPISICAGDSYTFNGTVYTTAGSYTAHLTNSVGCDSAATLVLTVKPVSISSTPISICAGDSYTFNGTVYKVAGSYTAHLTNSVGCDSAATLVLTVNNPSTSTTNASICEGNSYTFNGTVYNTAGSYTAHLINSVGCDSAATLVLTIKNPSTSTTTASICPGDSYTFNGTAYGAAGSYVAHLTNSVGCDSAANLVLSIKATSTSTTPISICAGDSYTFNGTVYSAAGSYTAHLTNSVGCDSAATLVLTVKAISISITKASICPGDSYTFNGTVYNTAGSYTAHLTNSVGCDSAATLVLTIKATSASTTKASICTGGSYTFNGTSYTTAGSYIAHLTNSVGCDSAATLILTVNMPTTSTTNASICDGTSYTFNGTAYTAAGSYTAHLTNSNGCDSVATLVLTINPKPVATPIAGPQTVDINQTITLVNATSGGVWSSTPTSIATIDNTGLLTGVSAGSANISYAVTNPCGTDMATYKVMVVSPVVFVPNVFSPNGDRVNDVFYVRGNTSNFTGIEFRVFDSWGGMIFESKGQVDDKSIGWDGTYKGKQQPPGVYIYIAKITLKSGETIVKKGAINLIR